MFKCYIIKTYRDVTANSSRILIDLCGRMGTFLLLVQEVQNSELGSEAYCTDWDVSWFSEVSEVGALMT